MQHIFSQVTVRLLILLFQFSWSVEKNHVITGVIKEFFLIELLFRIEGVDNLLPHGLENVLLEDGPTRAEPNQNEVQVGCRIFDLLTEILTQFGCLGLFGAE